MNCWILLLLSQESRALQAGCIYSAGTGRNAALFASGIRVTDHAHKPHHRYQSWTESLERSELNVSGKYQAQVTCIFALDSFLK